MTQTRNVSLLSEQKDLQRLFGLGAPRERSQIMMRLSGGPVSNRLYWSCRPEKAPTLPPARHATRPDSCASHSAIMNTGLRLWGKPWCCPTAIWRTILAGGGEQEVRLVDCD